MTPEDLRAEEIMRIDAAMKAAANNFMMVGGICWVCQKLVLHPCNGSLELQRECLYHRESAQKMEAKS